MGLFDAIKSWFSAKPKEVSNPTPVNAEIVASAEEITPIHETKTTVEEPLKKVETWNQLMVEATNISPPQTNEQTKAKPKRASRKRASRKKTSRQTQ